MKETHEMRLLLEWLQTARSEIPDQVLLTGAIVLLAIVVWGLLRFMK